MFYKGDIVRHDYTSNHYMLAEVLEDEDGTKFSGKVIYTTRTNSSQPVDYISHSFMSRSFRLIDTLVETEDRFIESLSKLEEQLYEVSTW